MKRMQKDSHRVLSLLLALILSVSLSACGGNGHKESSTVSESSKPQSEASSEASRIVSQPESDAESSQTVTHPESDAESSQTVTHPESDAESSQTVTHPESDTSGTQTVIEVTMEDLSELMPDILKLREKKYDEMPLLETQEQLSEYALWNFVSGSLEFECRIPWELSYGLSAEALDRACSDAMCYYLFSSYRPWDMLTEDDGDPDSVYAKVKIVYDVPEYDQEARLKAYSYVVNNPPPEGGFTDYEEEKEYARKVHDYIACRIAYDPIGYEPELPLTQTRYDIYQEAYNVLGEGQETAVCAGYARAFGLICQYAGINCAWVWGNETEDSSHAWNVLFPCDGSEPVLVDVTWDDGQSPDLPEQTYVDDTYFYIPLSAEYEHEADEEMWAFIQYLNEGARSR